MTVNPPRYLLALLVTTVIVAGCGGASDPPATPSAGSPTAATSPAPDRAFLDRADALCRPASVYATDEPFPYRDFDPRSPDPRELRGVGAYLRDSPLVSAMGKLGALSPPAGREQEWATFVARLDAYVGSYREQYDAALRRDAAAFGTLGGEVVAELGSVAAAARDVGFETTPDGCLSLFAG